MLMRKNLETKICLNLFLHKNVEVVSYLSLCLMESEDKGLLVCR